jgi:lipopolysaccharide export system protein LptC
MTLQENKLYLYIVVIALMSWWLAELTGVVEINHEQQAPAHSPDYFSKGYTKWEMNESGTLKKQLLAEEMIHYSDDGTTHMVNPLMYFYNDKTPPWIIKSETGILSGDGKDLLLNGKVTVNRAKAEGVSQLIINTSLLRVKPESSYAETNEWAELISPPNRTTGTGMKLIFAQPIHLELLANVKGKYETK